MKKILSVLLIIVTTLLLASCGNPIAKEYSNESYILIENHTDNTFYSLGITYYVDGVAKGGPNTVNADGSQIKDKTIEFDFKKQDFAGFDLSKLTFKLNIQESEDSDTLTIDLPKFDFEFGQDFFFMLKDTGGQYTLAIVK